MQLERKSFMIHGLTSSNLQLLIFLANNCKVFMIAGGVKPFESPIDMPDLNVHSCTVLYLIVVVVGFIFLPIDPSDVFSRLILEIPLGKR